TTVTETAAEIAGYTPDAATKSLTLAATGNEIVFYYTANEDISYVVKYLEKDTNKVLASEKTVTDQTMATTVTETAAEIAGYTPDAASKSLTLAATGNEIVFYYSKRSDLQYTVNYYLTNTATKVVESKVVGNQVFGARVTEVAIDIAGYVKPETESQTITIGVTGNEINFYYTRNSYTVTYKVDGAVVKSANAAYGTDVVVDAKYEKAGYTVTDWTTADAVIAEGKFQMPARNVELNATTAPTSYKIVYTLDGGALAEGVVNPESYTAEDADFTLNNPVKDGYVFEGWTGDHLTDKTVNVMVDTAWIQDLAYTANWLVDANRDGVADRYQVKLVYRAGANGTVSGDTEQYVTLTDATGNYVERAENRIPGKDGVVVNANNNYVENGWTPDPMVAMTFVGGETYTFTVNFRFLSSGGGGGGSRPAPTPTPDPDEEDLDEPDVPLAQLPELNTKDHVAYLVGRPDGTIAPLDNITRGEVATIFFRLLTQESRDANWSTSCAYTDMDGSEYYYNTVSTATKAGLIKGYTDGTFGGGNKITRAEMATIAARFLSDAYDGENLFDDIGGHWAAEYINRAAKAGWFKITNADGTPVGNFRPDDYITRAEVVVMINRMLERKADKDHLLPNMKNWPDNVYSETTAWYYTDIQEASNSHDYTPATDGPEAWVELIASPDWTALERR
ncbi:MAG: S-layer homology domain-containing protein, partial [Muribaculaceae bacterium]|nr:S-layer homology domain-containing protein [Muribaculaceae bacterium]